MQKFHHALRFAVPRHGLTIAFVLTACVPEFYQITTDSKAPQVEEDPLDESNDYNDIDFSGISGFNQLTDSTVSLYWPYHPKAKFYDIFSLEDHKEHLLLSVEGNITETHLTSLLNDRDYTLKVKLRDESNLPDKNNHSASFKTLKYPNFPTSFDNTIPGYSPSLATVLSFKIEGVKKGDSVSVYTDSACSNQVYKDFSDGTFFTFNLNDIPVGEVSFYTRVTGVHKNSSPCSEASLTHTKQVCPEGYIPVPGNSKFSTHDFCMMKYEAKALKADTLELNLDGCNNVACTTNGWASIFHPIDNPNGYRPVSVPEGKPWRRIHQNHARSACENLGNKYALTSNQEWMSVAESIEKNPLNWSSGIVSEGTLSGGHSDNNPSMPCDAFVANVETDCVTQGADIQQNRTHTLLNGETIWDMAGNAWEWTDWFITPAFKAYITSDGQPVLTWREFSNLLANGVNVGPNDSMPIFMWSPFDQSLHGGHRIGRYRAGNNTGGGGALRGGRWDQHSDTGVYTLSLNVGATSTDHYVGFRCSFRP
jgi:formylglycine-generating enzyme required for sulfatase activity